MLTTSGDEITVELAKMGRKKSSRGAENFDCNTRKIEVNTPVKVVQGTSSGRSGTIKHIFKSFVFIESLDEKGKKGIICARAQQTLLADMSTSKPALMGFDSSSEVPTGGGGYGAAGAAAARYENDGYGGGYGGGEVWREAGPSGAADMLVL